MRIPGWLQLVPAMLAASPATAVAGASESSFLETLPVVLSVSRLPSIRENTPGAVTIIDRPLIEATGYRNIARLLRLVPGMQVGQQTGNSYWVTYHGLGQDRPNKTQLLIDGNPASYSYTDAIGRGNLLALSVHDIERLEVLRGSDFAAHGSNGFLGVINVVTRQAGPDAGGTVRVSSGSPGIADVSAHVETPLPAGAVRLSAQSMGDEGFSGLRDASRLNGANVNGHVDSPFGRIVLQLGHASNQREVGFKDTPFNASGERDESQRSTYARLSLEKAWSPGHDTVFTIHGGHQRVRDEWTVTSRDWLPALDPPLDVPVNANSTGGWYSVGVHNRSEISHDLRLATGGEWRKDRLDSATFFHGLGTQTSTMIRLFANAEWQFEKDWLVNASALLERYEGEQARGAPRVFLIWQPMPSQSWRMGYSRAYHQPSIVERRVDARIVTPEGVTVQRRILPNPNLEAQRIDVLETGFYGRLEGGGHHDLRLFHETISDLIRRVEARNDSGDGLPGVQARIGSSRWENETSRVRLLGLEYEVRTPVWQGGEMFMTLGWIARASLPDSARHGVARQTASLTWLQDWRQWKTSASVLHRGRMNASTGFMPTYSHIVPSHTHLDLSIWRSLRIAGQPAEVRLSGINLLRRQQEVAHTPLQAASSVSQPNRSSRMIHASFSVGLD